MKAFWIILILVVAAAAAVLLMPREPSGAPDATPDGGAAKPAPSPAPAPAAAPAPKPDAPTPLPVADPGRNATGAAAQASKEPPKGAGPGANPGASPGAKPDAKPDATAPAPGGLDLGMHAEIPSATIARGSLVRQPDGSIVADGRYRISGAGTAEEPYRVSWECLSSASETFVPRLGETTIPQRIAMLDGKVVRIEGYVAFPLMQQETREVLLMLNQWDGCCIGVPPTPYDAIEVKLVEPIKNTRRHANFTYGGVTGVLKVEPYLVENWLVGLYTMEGATYSGEM